MGPRYVSANPDTDKSREQLLSELLELRVQVANLREADIKSKSIAEALRESEERFRQMVDNSPIPMTINDKDNNITYLNKKFIEVFGYTQEDIPNLMDWWSRAYPDPVYREDAIKRWEKGVEEAVRESKEIRPIDYTVTCKDGTTRYTEISGAPIGDKELILLQDVTERKRAEEALIYSEAKFKAIFEGAGAAIFIADVETGNIIECNSHAEILMGRPRSEIIGMHQSRLHPEGAEEKYKKIFALHVREDSVKDVEAEVQHRNGRRIPVWINAQLLKIDGRDRMIGLFFDITERKRAEEDIRAARNMLRLIMNNIPQSIFWKDSRSKYMGCNNVFAKAVGLANAGDIVGKTDYDLPWSREQAESFRKYDRRIMDNNAPEYHIVERQLEADGKLAWVETNKIPLHDTQGNVIGILGTCEVITERKLAEEKISHLASFPSLNPSPIIETDLEGNPSYMNPSAVKTFPDLNEKGAAHPMLTGLKAVADELEAQNKNYIFREVAVGDSYFQETVQKVPDKMALRIYALDITERKKAEDAVRKSDVRFRSLIQNSSDIIRILDNAGRIIYESPSSDKILGYPPGHTLGKSPLEFVHPDDRERVRNALDEVYSCKNPGMPTEFRIRKADGSYFEVESTGNNMVGVPGVDGIVITTRPITERKRAEEALQKSEERFRATFEQSAVGMTLVGLDGRFLRMNKKYCDLTGYEEDELLGLTVADITYPADVEAEREKVNKLLAGELDTFSNEKRYVRKDGSLIWVKLTVALVRYHGEPSYLTGVTEDITERKRAEDSLKESEERFRALADNIPNLAWMANADGWIFWYNKQWYDYTGTTLEDMQGWGWQKVHHPDYVKSVTEEWSTRIKEGKPYDNIFPLRGKDGKYRWFLTRVTPIRDAHGNIKRWFGTNTDITERRRAEEEVNAAKQQAELYLDLMGHDINNLHQIALGYLELARDMPPGEEQAIFLDKPVEVLQRSTQLIKNVRKLQKLRDGLFKTEQVDVCRVISDVQREFGAVPGKRIMLNFNGREHCFVLANELLHDVFANLVSNAIKHTGSRAEIVVDLDVIRDHGCRYCRVLVEDNGPGIPDDFKVKIFDRTLRGTNNAKGMGLGLYLVKSLVDSYGGRVWAEDRVKGDCSKGARFVVMLPADEK